MTEEKFIEILTDDDINSNWEGDNAFQGIQIIAKYFDTSKTIITGANHDEIYSVDVDEIVNAGITEEDAKKLRILNWLVNDESYLQCFV